MRIPDRGLALGICLALAGCLPIAVTNRFDVAEQARQAAVCASPEACDAAWARAVDWVSSNCAFRIQTQSDVLVQTEGPLGAPNTDVACRLERVPVAEGARLELTPSCGNWFECDPERDYFKAKFNGDMRAAITPKP
jgi:hypothetical protein